MTDNEHARIQILYNRFRALHKDINPYIQGGDIWQEWYSTHSMSEPIPKEMLPSDAQLRNFDIMEAQYIAANLAKSSEYSTLLAYGEWSKGQPIEETV